jgi:hypothetical protein
MALTVLKEVTEWNVDYRQPNHTYLMQGERVLGYQKWHEGAPIYYTTKQRLDKRRRKFEKIAFRDSPFKEVDILVDL